MSKHPITLSLVASLLTLAGCDKIQPAAAPEAPPPVEVTVVAVEPTDTPIVIEFVAKTASSRRVEIRSRVEGFLEEQRYVEGSTVEEGDVLFIMDKKPFEASLGAANAELAQHTARFETAETNLNRIRPLAEQKAVAQKELDDALGEYRTAAAAVEEAKAKVVQAELDLGYTTITTPVTGVSSYAVQQEGAYIGYGTESLLTYVAQVDPIWVEFSISENQILKHRDLRQRGLLEVPDEIEVQIILTDGNPYPHTGRITFADASLSEETGTFLIRAELPNPDSVLRPGQFVRAQLMGTIRPNALLVPQRAVQQASGGSVLWLVDESGNARLQPVDVGPWHDGEWFIDVGLEGGETVVVDGAQKLQAGAPVTTKPMPKEEPKADGGDAS
jgi:membrane fusion protein (multidrug efflux system)